MVLPKGGDYVEERMAFVFRGSKVILTLYPVFNPYLTHLGKSWQNRAGFPRQAKNGVISRAIMAFIRKSNTAIPKIS